jgi:hypothetical protein
MNAMMRVIPVIPRSGSRKVNGYVKAVLALEAVRRKREERYERVVRPLDRKRDELAAEVATRSYPSAKASNRSFLNTTAVSCQLPSMASAPALP